MKWWGVNNANLFDGFKNNNLRNEKAVRKGSLLTANVQLHMHPYLIAEPQRVARLQRKISENNKSNNEYIVYENLNDAADPKRNELEQ